MATIKGWAQTGNSLTIPGLHNPAVAAMSATDIAYIDDVNGQLVKRRFNGSNWSQVGSGLTVITSGSDNPALVALSSTDVVLAANGVIQIYRFSSSTWATVGSAFSIIGMTYPALAVFSSTDIAYLDNNGQLGRLRFNGSTWSLVGDNVLPLTDSTYPAITALNSNDLVICTTTGTNTNQLRAVRYNEPLWATLGNPLTVMTTGYDYPALTTLNSTNVALAVSSTDILLRDFQFDGTNFSQQGNALTVDSAFAPKLSALSSTDVAFCATTNSATDQLRVYRFDGSNMPGTEKFWRVPPRKRAWRVKK